MPKKYLGRMNLAAGGLREKSFSLVILISVLPFILSLILYLVNQEEFLIQQDK